VLNLIIYLNKKYEKLFGNYIFIPGWKRWVIQSKPSVICIFQEQFLAFIFANLKAKKYEIGNQDA